MRGSVRSDRAVREDTGRFMIAEGHGDVVICKRECVE